MRSQKLSLALLLLIASKGVGAQAPLSYGRFVQADTSVRWAGLSESVLPLVPATPQAGLDHFYKTQLAGPGLATYRPGPEPFTLLPQAASGARPPGEGVSVDAAQLSIAGTGADTLRPSWFLCDTCPVRKGTEWFRVQQLLYFRDGRFFVDNILVRPLLRTRGTSGTMGWYTPFATSFYPGGSAAEPPAADLRYLGRARVLYDFNFGRRQAAAGGQLLTYQEPNPIFAVLEEARRGRLQLRRSGDKRTEGRLVPPDSFFRVLGPPPVINDYIDDQGKVVVEEDRRDLDPDELCGFVIDQDLYFDTRRQVLLSRVRRVYLRKWEESLSTGERIAVTFCAIDSPPAPRAKGRR